MSTQIWSHPSDLGIIQSGTNISYQISVQVEQMDPITMEMELVDITDLIYEEVDNGEDDSLLDHILISDGGSTVSITGILESEADIVDIGYTIEDGKEQKVDEVDDIPFGSDVCTLIPSMVEYKYFKWIVYSKSQPDEISREFSLRVRTSWTQAKQTVSRLVEEIE